MADKQKERRGMDRRTFLKTVGIAAVGLGTSALPVSSRFVRPAQAGEPGAYERCRMVVFGADSLGFENAQVLRNSGAPGLNALPPPFCVSCDGLSVTQPGWATILSGLSRVQIECWQNQGYKKMPHGYHIFRKIMTAYSERDLDLYVVWITGKGKNITGWNDKTQKKGPHWSVCHRIEEQRQPGVYHGDKERDNEEVFELAMNSDGLVEAVQHDNFIAFIHFHDPDCTGHSTENYDDYMQAALEVDNYIYQMMNLLEDTDILYCSDHDFHFKDNGQTRNGHQFAPLGMGATNVPTLGQSLVSQASLGRFIYRRAGGNPDWTLNKEGRPYSMYGVEI